MFKVNNKNTRTTSMPIPTIPSHKVSFVVSLSSDYRNLFLYLLILLFYLFIISYSKVKSAFPGCNYFIFDRIRRKCTIFRNGNFSRFHPTIAVLLIYFCQNFRSSHQKCSIKKGVLKNFAKFTGKHLCQSLFLNKVVARVSF